MMRAIVTICMVLLCVQTADAEIKAENIVSPARADSLASPLTFRTIQTSTEADNFELFIKPTFLPVRIRSGIDTYFSSRNTLYDLPVIFAFSPDFQAQLNFPIVSATTDTPDSGRTTDTGIGDIRLSVKFRTDVWKKVESFFIVTAKFPSGNPDSGLSTGAYDFSLTHKIIFMHGDYRTTFMAGLTLPPSGSVTVLGSKVQYGPTVSYMAATERALSSTAIRFGIKAVGLHSFNSRVDSVYQQNAVTTLDVIPEVNYKISSKVSLNGGIVVPLLTIYDLPGAANRRDPLINFRLLKFF